MAKPCTSNSSINPPAIEDPWIWYATTNNDVFWLYKGSRAVTKIEQINRIGSWSLWYWGAQELTFDSLGDAKAAVLAIVRMGA
jgi:hypothetical protein